MKLPWKTKGIVLTAPLSEDVDDVVAFIDGVLAPNGFNLIVLQIRYRYRFRRHPECVGYDPLSDADVGKLVAVCRKNGIRLVPKMNLLGHQSGLPNTPTDGILHGHNEAIPDFRDGLLRAYPDLDEEAGKPATFYSRSLCLTNPLVKTIVFDLVDELLEAFGADAIHVGCDEAFNIGICPECRKHSHADLIAGWFSALHDHIASRGAEMFVWGDRLLSSERTGFHGWESSNNGTEGAIDRIPKDIVVCDWHYESTPTEFLSVDEFADKGFRMFVSPWRVQANAERFLRYAIEHDRGHILGVLCTTWCGSGELARHLMKGEPPRFAHTAELARTLKALFLEESHFPQNP